MDDGASRADLARAVSRSRRTRPRPRLPAGFCIWRTALTLPTTDIDVLVPATLESGARMKAALMVLPDQVARDLEPEWFTEGDNIRVADAFLVDVMLNACGETYATLKQYAITVDLDGIPVRTVSLEGLLRTKQTVRDKDVADRHILEQALALLKKQAE